MEISAEKTKLIRNNTSGINTKIKVNGQKLENVTSLKYLGSVITDEGSKLEILSCMLVNHGPSQQSSKEEYKPWK